MSIDFCASSVWNERKGLDTQPPPPKSLADFGTFRELKEYLDRQREDAEKNAWIQTVEVIPPTTLFTDPTNPGIRINLGLPVVPKPKPRAMREHFVVPAIGSRDVACAEWPNIRRFEHFL
jgi:hypothetical protein